MIASAPRQRLAFGALAFLIALAGLPATVAGRGPAPRHLPNETPTPTHVLYLPLALRQRAAPPTATVTPSPTRTLKPSATATPSFTLSATLSSPTAIRTATPSLTPSATITPSPTATASFTPSATPSPTASQTATPSLTPSATITPSPTATASFTPSATPSPTASRTATPSLTPSATITPSPTPTASSTATPSPTPTGVATPLVIVHGLVTWQGQPAEGVAVQLWVYEDGWEYALRDVCVTDERGYYSCQDAIPLQPGQIYKVRYQNDGLSRRLAEWRGDPLPSDPSGSVYYHDFDIADVSLVYPDSMEPEPFPVFFQWTPRDPQWLPGEVYDEYTFVLCQEATETCYVEDHLLEGVFVLEALPPGFDYSPCRWWIEVDNISIQTGESVGWGRSWDTYPVVFAWP